MRATLVRLGGGGPQVGKYGVYIGQWGNLGSPVKQRGIITYGLSPNRQRPFAGALTEGVFNTWRRFSKEACFWLPPALIYLYVWHWADEKNKYINSKAGRAELGEDEDED